MMDEFLKALVLLAAAPVLGGMVLLFSLFINRHAVVTAGWALARWASSEPWRPPALCALLGMAALDVAFWSARLGMPIVFVCFLVVLVKFIAGLAGDDGGIASGSLERNPDWTQWRRP
jgi:hypothetical protein